MLVYTHSTFAINHDAAERTYLAQLLATICFTNTRRMQDIVGRALASVCA